MNIHFNAAGKPISPPGTLGNLCSQEKTDHVEEIQLPGLRGIALTMAYNAGFVTAADIALEM